MKQIFKLLLLAGCLVYCTGCGDKTKHISWYKSFEPFFNVYWENRQNIAENTSLYFVENASSIEIETEMSHTNWKWGYTFNKSGFLTEMYDLEDGTKRNSIKFNYELDAIGRIVTITEENEYGTEKTGIFYGAENEVTQTVREPVGKKKGVELLYTYDLDGGISTTVEHELVHHRSIDRKSTYTFQRDSSGKIVKLQLRNYDQTYVSQTEIFDYNADGFLLNVSKYGYATNKPYSVDRYFYSLDDNMNEYWDVRSNNYFRPGSSDKSVEKRVVTFHKK